MRIKVLSTLIACLTGFLGLALAAPGNRVDISSDPSQQHLHHLHPHGSRYPHDVNQQKRHIPQSPNGPVYRCHDPHPELFVSDLVVHANNTQQSSATHKKILADRLASSLGSRTARRGL